MKKINFVFIRHGQSCQNLLSQVRLKDTTTARMLFDKYADPTLSDKGIRDSIKAGEKLKKYGLNSTSCKCDIVIDNFDIVGSSPMIRSIETGYYMNGGNGSSSNNSKTVVYPFPFLREISKDTANGRDTVDHLNKVFPIKSIQEQKEYFEHEGIPVNFKYVANQNRYSPGDLTQFIHWFCSSRVYSDFGLSSSPEINVLIITHSHVLLHDTLGSFRNNSGILVEVTISPSGKVTWNTYDNGTTFRYDGIFKYTSDTSDKGKLDCPTSKCPNLCDFINN